ncbi:MAG: hypothetical protein CL988_03085 [Euryarchaeota archaeon]|nr:hypothetical protein [Euryarchaeota archaeon]
MESESTFSNVAPRGSLQRFGLAGAFNSLIFFILWELFRFFSSNDKASIQFAWGAAWGLASFLAHFVHRWFTFDKRKSVQWTIGSSTIAYAFSLTGSTYTIGLAATQNSGTLRMLGILNMLVWGLIIWAIMRILVFQYKTED